MTLDTFSEYTNIYTEVTIKKKMAKIATDRKANFFSSLQFTLFILQRFQVGPWHA